MPEHLTAAARARHTETRARADAALLALSNAGEPVTFAAVARRAKVSTDFLYNHPDLRVKIAELRAQRPSQSAAVAPEPVPAKSASSAVRALSAQLKAVKRRHATEVSELRKALEVAQGENLMLRRGLGQQNS